MLRVGSGSGGALRLLLLLLFVFEFVFSFAGAGLRSSSGIEGSTLAAGLALTFAGGVMVPPDGIPCSLFPVGDAPGCTGWLLGSAASVSVGC